MGKGGGVPVREAVCDPHCPLTEKGRVKRTLGAEPLSPGALASRATLTKGRRRGGGGGGDRGRLFSRRSAGAKRGLGSRGPGAPCSCEGGASRPASWGPLQQGAAPAPGPSPPPPPTPHVHPRSPRRPSRRPGWLWGPPCCSQTRPRRHNATCSKYSPLRGSRKDVNLGRTRSTQHAWKSLRDNGFLHREEV